MNTEQLQEALTRAIEQVAWNYMGDTEYSDISPLHENDIMTSVETIANILEKIKQENNGTK